MSIENVFPNAEQGERVARALETIAANSAPITAALDATLGAILNGSNTTQVFRSWYAQASAASPADDRYTLLCRFAAMLRNARGDKVYTLKYVEPTTSGAPAMTPVGDLAQLSAAQLCTDSTTPVADWTDEDPLGGWYIRANALSLADGTMNVLAIEGVDDAFDITGNTAPVYTFAPALWRRKWTEGGYIYKSWSLTNPGGYTPYAGDVAPDNTKRDLTWRPTFPGGYDSQGRLGSGRGQKPFIRRSANQGIASARTVTAYEGLWNDADAIWALDMWQLRHWNLENSDICNGCQSYDFRYTAAVTETGVKRVLITAAQAANLQVGSNVSIGTNASADRGAASSYSLGDCVRILSMDTVTVDSTEYVAVNLDLDAGIDVTAGTTQIITMPWDSGNTERLPGHKDGACYSLTAGRNPLRIMGVEMMSGAYDIGLDPLYNVTNFADGHGDYAVFECRDSENLSGSITADYEDTGIAYAQMPQGWQYVKRFADTDKAALFPAEIGGSSTTFFKSAFYGAASAGVRCPWRYGDLYYGAFAGLACESGLTAPPYAYWNGRPRLSGSGKKRGEWAA